MSASTSTLPRPSGVTWPKREASSKLFICVPHAVGPAFERHMGGALVPLDLLGSEEAVRPHGDVGAPLVVEAGAVPEPLRSVQAEGEDHPLGGSGPDRVVDDL